MLYHVSGGRRATHTKLFRPRGDSSPPPIQQFQPSGHVGGQPPQGGPRKAWWTNVLPATGHTKVQTEIITCVSCLYFRWALTLLC